MRYEEPEMEVIEFERVGTTIIEKSQTGNTGDTSDDEYIGIF